MQEGTVAILENDTAAWLTWINFSIFLLLFIGLVTNK